MRKIVWAFIVLSSGLVSCRNFFHKRITGNGVQKSVERPVSPFKNVEVSGSINVFISQGDFKPVRIEGDENLLPYIEVIQKGDRLIVKNKSNYNLNPTEDIQVYVTAPVYSSISVSGAGDLTGQTRIVNPENLELEASGAGDIKMELDAPRVSAEVDGSGNIDLKGQTKEAKLTISGAGHAHCYDLLSETTSISISGAGSAEVFASVKLEADLSGAGSVSYKGNASNVEQHVSGLGSVSKAN